MALTQILDKRQDVDLKRVHAAEHHGLDRAECETRLKALGEELRNLQERLYAAAHHSLLLVLQGPDASGKDGTIRSVLDYVNPQGCIITPFKVPTAEELAHDFLWRIHLHAPRRGMIAVFNRSHYEDVLVVRVHNLVPREALDRRYDQINDFEALLARNQTIILKFYLHISREEQEERLLAREQDTEKAWKLSAGDWRERKSWDAYREAYSIALGRCSTGHAPWHVVPANHKWFRNLAVADAIVNALRPHTDGWRADLEERGRKELAAIRALRLGPGSG